jgi:restriction system protein
MTIPKYTDLYNIILKLANENKQTGKVFVREPIYKEFSLSETEINECYTHSGIKKVVDRIGWAFEHLKQAQLLNNTSHGKYEITDEGKRVLNSNVKIDNKYLSRYESFNIFRNKRRKKINDSDINKSTENNIKASDIDNDISFEDDSISPDEKLETAFNIIENVLISDLKERLLQLSPTSFEKLVLEVMKGIGYGLGGMLQHTGGTADGGIDGVIYEDALGLNQIYIQAKRYNGYPINSEEIQRFVGVLDGRNVTRGVFITTSSFTSKAKKVTETGSKLLKLIDGDELVNLMIKNSIGVRIYNTYELKRIDSDFFTDLED